MRVCDPRQNEDYIFDYLTIASLCFFFLEIVLSSFALKKYFPGFYFWLDLVSTVSLLTDIGFVWESIVDT